MRGGAGSKGGGSDGGGMGGKLGLEIVTVKRDLGMPRSADSWSRIRSSFSIAMRSKLSAILPGCVMIMRAITDCSREVTGTELSPKAIALPNGSVCVRLALSARARVVVSVIAARRRPAAAAPWVTVQLVDVSIHSWLTRLTTHSRVR